MSVQNAAEFLAKVSQDRGLASQLENIKTAEEFISFAQQQGYEFSQAEMAEVQAAIESNELSEDQLEAVAGGLFIPDRWGSIRFPSPPQKPYWGEVNSKWDSIFSKKS